MAYFSIKNPFIIGKQTNDTASYFQQAKDEFEPKTYAERNRMTFIICQLTSNFYHVVSVLLGLATAYLISSVGSGVYYAPPDNVVLYIIIAVFFGLLITLVLIGTEFLKSTSAIQVFKNLSAGDKVSPSSIVALSACMMISIALSGVGGSFIAKLTSDQASLLKTALTHKTDSLNRYYNDEISLAEDNAKSYHKSNSYQGVITWTKDGSIAKQYAALKQRPNTLKDEHKNSISMLRAEYAGKLTRNSKSSWQNAYIAFAIILFLEVLTLFCYRYRFIYQANTYQEGLSMGTVKPWTVAFGDGASTVTVLRANDDQIKHPDQKTVSATHTQNPIGFQMRFAPQNEEGGKRPIYDSKRITYDPPAPQSIQFKDDNGTVRNGFLVVCAHCGKTCVRLSSQARFCSDAHRRIFHRKKAMKQLRDNMKRTV